MQHSAAVASKVVFSGATAGCSCILSVLYATTWPAVALKLTVPDATTGRCFKKIQILYSTRTTAVTIKFAVQDATSGGSWEKNLQFQMRPQAVPNATLPAVARKTYSSICDHVPQ